MARPGLGKLAKWGSRGVSAPPIRTPSRPGPAVNLRRPYGGAPGRTRRLNSSPVSYGGGSIGAAQRQRAMATASRRATPMMQTGMPRPRSLGGQTVPSNVPMIGGPSVNRPRGPSARQRANKRRITANTDASRSRLSFGTKMGIAAGGAVGVGVIASQNRSGRATDPGHTSMYSYRPPIQGGGY